METGKRHIIHRQILELEIERKMSDEEIREQYQQKLADEMMIAMEAIFDGLSSENEMLIIDEIDLDLGEVPENEILDRFQTTLTKKLKLLIKAAKDSKAKTSSDILKINREHFLSEDFLFYLKNGYMPWWSELKNLDEFEEIFKGIIQNRAFSDSLKEVLENPDSRRRLSQQFYTGFNLRIIKLLFPHYSRLSETLIKKLTELIMLQNSRIGLRRVSAAILENIWQILIRHKDDSEIVLHFQERVIASIIADLNLEIEEMAGKFPQIDILLLHDLVKLHKQTKSEKNKDFDQKEQEEFAIDNGGLIILWPYLVELYDKLHLLNEDKLFQNIKMQERGILISQYLINGNTEIQEHQLVLNKILHGWPVRKPVQAVLNITEEEQELLNEFLSQVIKNWPMLKNSSIEALRESFLQRKGTLRKTDNGWNLQVKRSGIDILRDRLPWPISIINLSWMRTIIYVKW